MMGCAKLAVALVGGRERETGMGSAELCRGGIMKGCNDLLGAWENSFSCCILRACEMER